MPSMTRLSDYFERICVLNLPSRPDRRAKLEQHLKETGLADPKEVVWVRAISGDLCRPPSYFQAGRGAWGCLQSHLRLAQDAAMDGISSYLVLEDDVTFHPKASAILERFMQELPQDWGQLYLGGQHMQAPLPVSGKPSVLNCRNVNRTHSYALHKRAMAIFQQHITHAPDYIERGSWHVDHQLGLAHERWDWKTYAPAWWLAGQDEGASNISSSSNPQFWWHWSEYSRGLPFILASSEIDGEETRKLQGRIHFGQKLKPGSLQEIGLAGCVGNRGLLREWLDTTAMEALDRGMLPGIQHPRITVDRIDECWEAGAIPASSADLSFLLDYPFNGLFAHPFVQSGS